LHQFSPAFLAVVPLLVLQLVLSFLMGYLLALFAAAMRDTMQIVTFLLSIGIFVSPILFPITMFPQNWRWVLWGNPMTGLVTGYQSVLLQGNWPEWSSWISTLVWIVAMATALNAVIGRSRDQLADWL
jgi:lipopolysaccharide transport system permease protein